MDLSKLFEKEDSPFRMLSELGPVFYPHYARLMRLGFTHQQAFELTKDCKQGLTKLKGES